MIFWLEKRGIEATEERVTAIYNRAKQSDRLLTDGGSAGNDHRCQGFHLIVAADCDSLRRTG